MEGKRQFGYEYQNSHGILIIFGIRLSWRDTTVHPLLFSERNGYSKGIQIGKWWLKTIRKEDYNTFLSIEKP